VRTIATPDADSAARQDLLERYAWLAIRVGINLEPGREVAIRAMIEHAPLVRALVRAGYEAGARLVEVDYEGPGSPAEPDRARSGRGCRDGSPLEVRAVGRRQGGASGAGVRDRFPARRQNPASRARRSSSARRAR
jgi:hypothetical protein